MREIGYLEQNNFKEKFKAARTKAIASEFSHLNGMQQRAVMKVSGPLLLLAGAGSGKTTVLVNRIANLIKYGSGADSDFVPESANDDDLRILEQPEASQRRRELMSVNPVEPWRILAITFTNKAADEFKARLANMLGDKAGDIWAMTFHSACVRILRRDIEHLGYNRNFTIYDTSDSQTLMKQILADMNLDEKIYPRRTVLNYISRAKDAMLDPEEYREQADGDIRKTKIATAYMEYQQRMKAAGALDFDDLILMTVRLLTEHKDVREYYQKKFRHVLIDEYQDTNNLQYLLARTLSEGHKNICVVGDDDQSIYKFRGATIENILNFEKQYKDAVTIKLEQNYRSTSHILDAANAVIKNNEGRKGKELWTENGEGELICEYTGMDEKAEANYIASEIISSGKHFRDNAVLYRMNALSNQIEYAFKRNAIPYRVIGGTGFFNRAEVRDALAYLCVINNPGDNLRLLRIINTPTRGIGAKSIEAVREIAASEDRPVYEVLKDSGSYDELGRSSAKLRLFVNMMEDLREELCRMPLDEFYDYLLDKTGYVTMLEANPTENASRIENIKELKSNIVNFMEESEEKSLSAFLDEIALYTDLELLDSENDCVTMMTLHSAKGLEFPTVFVVGMEDGIFPGVRSIGEAEEMEEERRLCYVGITRAKEKLYVTNARQRMLFGRTTANMRSRFLEEIPKEHIEKPKNAAAPTHKWEYAKTAKKPSPALTGRQSGASPASFNCGDMVDHKAFGNGTITSIQKMGGDALVEIAFDAVGTKRLMLNSAAQHMKKSS